MKSNHRLPSGQEGSGIVWARNLAKKRKLNSGPVCRGVGTLDPGPWLGLDNVVPCAREGTRIN